MEKTEKMVNRYMNLIMKVAKYRMSEEKKSKILADLLTKYDKACYDAGIDAYNPLAYKKGIGNLEHLSYIIESKPEIFDLDEDEVRAAWGHLLDVKENGGGITEEEANLLLDWSVQRARTVLGRSSYNGGIMMDSLNGSCGYSQMLTLVAFKKAGVKITINNVSKFLEKSDQHAFGTVTFPIEKDGKVEEKQYLIDATYRQFFTTIRCNEGRYYSAQFPGKVGPDAGYYMIKYLDGRKVATEILKKGHIELTPEVLKKYVTSFVAESLNINNKDNIYKLIEEVDVEKYRKIIEDKQEEFDSNEEELEEALIEVGFPSLDHSLR